MEWNFSTRLASFSAAFALLAIVGCSGPVHDACRVGMATVESIRRAIVGYRLRTHQWPVSRSEIEGDVVKGIDPNIRVEQNLSKSAEAKGGDVYYYVYLPCAKEKGSVQVHDPLVATP